MKGKWHPINSIIFFIIVLFYTMYATNLVITGISLLSSLIAFLLLHRGEKKGKILLFYLFIGIIIIVTNPLFGQNGETILFNIGKYKYTLESLVYGGYASMMIISILLWFGCYNKIITADKFLYLFGKVAPSTSITLTMGMRFIPEFIKRGKRIRQAQKNIGITSSNFKGKVVNASKQLSILVSASLENSMEVSNSMKARGYGLNKRTNYSIYKFRCGDFVQLVIQLLYIVIMIMSIIYKYTDFVYYPKLDKIDLGNERIILYIVTLLFMLLPSIKEIWEDLKWKFLESKI